MLGPMLQRFPIISRIFLSAAITAGTLGLAEWALSDNDWSGALYAGDPGGMWWLKGDLDLPAVPHIEEGTHFAVKTNAIGLRDGLMPVASPWVLALGCSTTFGWGSGGGRGVARGARARAGCACGQWGDSGHSTEQGLVIAPKLLVHKPDVDLWLGAAGCSADHRRGCRSTARVVSEEYGPVQDSSAEAAATHRHQGYRLAGRQGSL